jgi:DNA-binding PadR family transcriptional regulator
MVMGEVRQKGPLKPRVFQILLLLGDGERHGWSIVKELQAQAGDGNPILPGSLYRTLNDMMEKGLIEEAPDAPGNSEDGRRRYLRVTELGIETARAEAERLEDLVRTARSKSAFFPSGAKA